MIPLDQYHVGRANWRTFRLRDFNTGFFDYLRLVTTNLFENICFCGIYVMERDIWISGIQLHGKLESVCFLLVMLAFQSIKLMT